MVIRCNALNGMINFGTKFCYLTNILVVLLASVKKQFLSVNLFDCVKVMDDRIV